MYVRQTSCSSSDSSPCPSSIPPPDAALAASAAALASRSRRNRGAHTASPAASVAALALRRWRWRDFVAVVVDDKWRQKRELRDVFAPLFAGQKFVVGVMCQQSVSIMLTRTRAVDWVWVRNRMKHALRGMAEQVCRVYNTHAHPARWLSHLASQSGM